MQTWGRGPLPSPAASPTFNPSQVPSLWTSRFIHFLMFPMTTIPHQRCNHSPSVNPWQPLFYIKFKVYVHLLLICHIHFRSVQVSGSVAAFWQPCSWLPEALKPSYTHQGLPQPRPINIGPHALGRREDPGIIKHQKPLIAFKLHATSSYLIQVQRALMYNARRLRRP